MCGSRSALSLSRAGGCKGFLAAAAETAEVVKLRSLRVDRRESMIKVRERVDEDHARRD